MAKARKSRQQKRASARAERFPIHAPVRYRVADGPWHQGTTKNISRSGLLLQAEVAPTPNTPIEMVVELPSVLEGEGAARVVCRGRVVRTETLDEIQGTMLAAEITAYRIGRDLLADPTTDGS
jgi:hypothetical protein